MDAHKAALAGVLAEGEQLVAAGHAAAATVIAPAVASLRAAEAAMRRTWQERGHGFGHEAEALAAAEALGQTEGWVARERDSVLAAVDAAVAAGDASAIARALEAVTHLESALAVQEAKARELRRLTAPEQERLGPDGVAAYEARVHEAEAAAAARAAAQREAAAAAQRAAREKQEAREARRAAHEEQERQRKKDTAARLAAERQQQVGRCV